MDISSLTLSRNIENLKYDINRYEQKYGSIENDVVNLEYEFQRAKSELNENFSVINKNLSREIFNISDSGSFVTDKEMLFNKIAPDLSESSSLVTRCDNILIEIQEIIQTSQMLVEQINNTANEVNKNKAACRSKTAMVNPHIVHSRQTKNPFIVSIMLPGRRYQCNGCRGTIPLQLPYLVHSEEYPAGTKMFKPHSYHIIRDCLTSRGFEDDYLGKIKVISEEEICPEVMKELRYIGFSAENIRMKDEPDCDSEGSEAGSELSGASPDPRSTVFFTYRRKHLTQKKKVECAECQTEITTDCFLSTGSGIDKAFHLKKKCVQGVVSGGDFSRVKCKVYKMLKSHQELTQVLGCGFFYKNIIGNKPPNPSIKMRPQLSSLRPSTASKPTLKDTKFLFNGEPFVCERLVHAERCQGCGESVRKSEMTLRHKERIPRDRLADTPLVSQFYHPTKDCLTDRGFTARYIELASCNTLLSGSDNIQKIRDLLVRCGFSGERLTFGPAEDASRDGALPSSATVERPSKESYLFIVNCAKSSTKCEGCATLIPVNRPCFVYGTQSAQDAKARLFHIDRACLRKHFTDQQVLAMTCINSNSMVDVNPADIVRCGIVNIRTSLPGQMSRAPGDGARINPLQSSRPRFVLDTSLHNAGMCAACKQPLNLDKFVLRATSNGGAPPVNMHLAAECVRKCGHFPQQLAQCDISLLIFASPLARQRLDECGFRDLPRD